MKRRGSLSVYRNFFEREIDLSSTKRKQGRSSELINQRNECLIDRYFYYCSKVDDRGSKIAYSSVLELLQKEFFINADFTIPQILTDNSEQLTELKKRKSDVKYFRKKWPHLSW